MTETPSTPRDTSKRYFATYRERMKAKRQIAKLKKAGKTTGEISELMGIPVTTVQYHAMHPAPVRHRHGRRNTIPAETEAMVRRIIASNDERLETYAGRHKIARECGISEPTVRRIMATVLQEKAAERFVGDLHSQTAALRSAPDEVDMEPFMPAILAVARLVFGNDGITEDQVRKFLSVSAHISL